MEGSLHAQNQLDLFSQFNTEFLNVQFCACCCRNGHRIMLFMLELAVKIQRKLDGGIMVSLTVCVQLKPFELTLMIQLE